MDKERYRAIMVSHWMVHLSERDVNSNTDNHGVSHLQEILVMLVSSLWEMYILTGMKKAGPFKEVSPTRLHICVAFPLMCRIHPPRLVGIVWDCFDRLGRVY